MISAISLNEYMISCIVELKFFITLEKFKYASSKKFLISNNLSLLILFILLKAIKTFRTKFGI